MKIHKNEKGKWCYSFICNGRRVRKVVGLSKQECEAVADAAHDRIKRDGFGIQVPSEKVLFETFAKGLITDQKFKRPSTLRSRQTCLNALLKSELFKDKKLRDITAEAVATYYAARAGDRLVSANRELGFLKLVFKRALEWGKVSRNPAALIKKHPEPKTKLRVLTDDEAERLLAAASSSLAPFLTVLLTTAMRPHEVFALHWAHDGWETEDDLTTSIVCLEKRVIFIPGTLAKNHKDREVPLSRELLALFKTLPRDPASAKVFPWNSVPKSFRAAVKAAKIKGVDLYTLKHTAASRMIRAGVDLVTVTELIGHADVKTTMIYCHSSSDTKREAVEKLSRIYLPGKGPSDAPKTPKTTAKNSAIGTETRVASASYANN